MRHSACTLRGHAMQRRVLEPGRRRRCAAPRPAAVHAHDILEQLQAIELASAQLQADPTPGALQAAGWRGPAALLGGGAQPTQAHPSFPAGPVLLEALAAFEIRVANLLRPARYWRDHPHAARRHAAAAVKAAAGGHAAAVFSHPGLARAVLATCAALLLPPAPPPAPAGAAARPPPQVDSLAAAAAGLEAALAAACAQAVADPGCRLDEGRLQRLLAALHAARLFGDTAAGAAADGAGMDTPMPASGAADSLPPLGSSSPPSAASSQPGADSTRPQRHLHAAVEGAAAALARLAADPACAPLLLLTEAQAHLLCPLLKEVQGEAWLQPGTGAHPPPPADQQWQHGPAEPADQQRRQPRQQQQQQGEEGGLTVATELCLPLGAGRPPLLLTDWLDATDEAWQELERASGQAAAEVDVAAGADSSGAGVDDAAAAAASIVIPAAARVRVLVLSRAVVGTLLQLHPSRDVRAQVRSGQRSGDCATACTLGRRFMSTAVSSPACLLLPCCPVAASPTCPPPPFLVALQIWASGLLKQRRGLLAVLSQLAADRRAVAQARGASSYAELVARGSILGQCWQALPSWGGEGGSVCWQQGKGRHGIVEDPSCSVLRAGWVGGWVGGGG